MPLPKCIPLTQAILQLENRCDGNKENGLLDWHYQWAYDGNDILRVNIWIFKCVIPFQQEEKESHYVLYCLRCFPREYEKHSYPSHDEKVTKCCDDCSTERDHIQLSWLMHLYTGNYLNKQTIRIWFCIQNEYIFFTHKKNNSIGLLLQKHGILTYTQSTSLTHIALMDTKNNFKCITNVSNTLQI